MISALNIKYRRFDAALNLHIAMSVENSVFVQSHPLTRADVPYLNLASSSTTEDMHLQQHAEPATAKSSSSALAVFRVSPLRARSELHSHPRLNIATTPASRPNQVVSSFARAFKDLQYISSTCDPTWIDAQRRHADAAQLQRLESSCEAAASTSSSYSACGPSRPEHLPEFRADDIFPNLLSVRSVKPRISSCMSNVHDV